jgi:hypothetical protein
VKDVLRGAPLGMKPFTRDLGGLRFRYRPKEGFVFVKAAVLE